MSDSVTVHHVEARTHGRILIRTPAAPGLARRSPNGERGPWPTLIGFHGYAEDADTHFKAISAIPGVESWLLVAVQALHPFYTRQNRIVANWMTSQDRELAIGDNIDYVARVLAQLQAGYGLGAPIVFAGFSQGGAMAYRAAAHFGAAGVLILAADVPPDVARMPDLVLPSVLIGRGTKDAWYTEEKHLADLETLRRLGAVVDNCVFDGGHEWTQAFCVAAGVFLDRLAGPLKNQTATPDGGA